MQFRLMRFVMLLVAISMLATALAGCGQPAAAPTATPAAKATAAPAGKPTTAPAATAPTQASGKVTIAVSRDVTCWNPNEGPCGSDVSYHDLITERLLRFDANLKLAPGLAESWRLVDDLTWELKLRKNIKFTNGEPFNADAVVFMFQPALHPDKYKPPASTPGRYRFLKEVKVIDEYTVQLITSQPYPVLGNYLAFEPKVVPPKYYQEVGMDGFSAKPIGTGMYKLIEWVKNDHYTLEANPDYWGVKPTIKTLVFRPIPEEATRLAEVLAGGVDIAATLSGDLAGEVNKSNIARLVTAPGTRSVYVNLRPADKIQSKPLREAFFYATDIDTIIKTLLDGVVEKTGAGNSISRYEFGADFTIPVWPYDPEKAKAKLKEANYDGKEFVMHWSIGSLPAIDKVAEALQAQWAAVGLKVKLAPMESGVFNTAWRATAPMPGDIYLISGGAATMESEARMNSEVRCVNAATGAGRVSYYCNQEVEKLLDQAVVTMDDAKREALYKQAWRIHRDDAAILALWTLRGIFAVNNRIDWPKSIDENWTDIVTARIVK